MKTYFYCFKKNGFWEHINQKHTLIPKQIFCVFFKNKKQLLKTRTKQTYMIFLTKQNKVLQRTVRIFFISQEFGKQLKENKKEKG